MDPEVVKASWPQSACLCIPGNLQPNTKVRLQTIICHRYGSAGGGRRVGWRQPRLMARGSWAYPGQAFTPAPYYTGREPTYRQLLRGILKRNEPSCGGTGTYPMHAKWRRHSQAAYGGTSLLFLLAVTQGSQVEQSGTLYEAMGTVSFWRVHPNVAWWSLCYLSGHECP
jgi:hypothetical protein